MTIEQLKIQTANDIRAKVAVHSVTRDNVSDGLDSLADALLERGNTIVADTTALSALSGTNYKIATVANIGMFKWEASGAIDGIDIFAASGGGVWVKKFEGGSGGSGGGVTSITYAELVMLIGTSGLVEGAKYKITDFATTHYLNDVTDPFAHPQNTSVIFTGITEPLIITAITTNTISPIAESVLHPGDYINYDWNPDNWRTDIVFGDVSNYDYVNANTCVIIPNFKGAIYFRHDIINDNSCGFDFRNVKFRRYKSAAPAWDSGTTYAKGTMVYLGSDLYISNSNSNLNNSPTGLNQWVKTGFTVNHYLNTGNVYNDKNPSDLAQYIDTLMFTPSVGGTYEGEFKSIHFARYQDSVQLYYAGATIVSNNVLINTSTYQNYPSLYNVSFGQFSVNNTIIGNGFSDNKFGSYTSNNKIRGTYCYSLNVGNAFHNNYIGVQCSGSTIENNCYDNVIGENFIANTVCVEFHHNYTSYSTGGNFFGNNFSYNVLKVFASNITSEPNFSNINFNSATLISLNGSKTLFRNSSSLQRIRYYNSSDVLVVAPAAD